MPIVALIRWIALVSEVSRGARAIRLTIPEEGINPRKYHVYKV